MSTKDVIKKLILFLGQFRLLLILSFLCAILSVLLNVYAPLLIGKLLDCFSSNLSMEQCIPLLIQLACVYLFFSFFQWGMMYCSNRIAFSSSGSLRNKLYDKITHLPISFFDQHAKGDLISRFINDIDLISDGFLQGLSTMMSGITTIVFALICMLNIHVIMTMIVVVSAPFTYIIARIITKRSQTYFRKQATALGALNGYSEEMISGIKTVKAYHYENKAMHSFKALNHKLYESGVRSQFYGSLANPSTRFVTNFTYALVGATGAFLALFSKVTIGNISSFLIYATLFSKPFTEITGVMTQLQSAVESGRRIFTLFDLEEESEDADFPKLIQKAGAINIKHLAFAYEDHHPLMKDISFSIAAGQKIAIVGKTGAGKTTLVNLLLRFYDIQKGQIEIDGQDIYHVTRNSLRSCFGMVLQDTYLFEGTIHENIAYGCENATEEDVIAAAKRSGAHDFIRRLPQGYQTVLKVGNETLSSGQRQLISITRILLMNPLVLILDEATSHMDTVSERKVNNAMQLLMKEKTCFVIAHRLSTILDADWILVMSNGDIIEQGNHETLMKLQGSYYELYQSQFA
ncbi:ABC transporter ATP-binding protein [[Eubacterium] hominis]|uniref:ABC transporter ATP-binding protein n=1 Tax=[Eubacterium] hominis TaxID=2764325 RepID=UPI003A4D8F8B